VSAGFTAAVMLVTGRLPVLLSVNVRMAGEPISTLPKASEAGATARKPRCPLHVSVTSTGDCMNALLAIRNVPGRAPWAVGAQTRLHVTVPIGGTIVICGPVVPDITM
jgi:hypothetical protein